ncbi:MAG: HAD family hydrolase [Acidimicrobiia bacterium]
MTRPLDRHAAVLFDLDGVLTPTAEVHRAAWKRTFDRLLQSLYGSAAELFTLDDYLKYVDGKPRYDGVHSFLTARGIDLPPGDPSDPPSLRTEAGVGNLKNDEFRAVLEDDGVRPYPGSVALLDHLRDSGVAVAVVSSSANAAAVLGAAGLADRFALVVDGIVARQERLEGKPAPDTFLFAADRLGVRPEDTAIVEDASSGVEAGAAGRFGLVVGVAREDNEEDLHKAGADLVVADLAELLPPERQP